MMGHQAVRELNFLFHHPKLNSRPHEVLIPAKEVFAGESTARSVSAARLVKIALDFISENRHRAVSPEEMVARIFAVEEERTVYARFRVDLHRLRPRACRIPCGQQVVLGLFESVVPHDGHRAVGVEKLEFIAVTLPGKLLDIDSAREEKPRYAALLP